MGNTSMHHLEKKGNPIKKKNCHGRGTHHAAFEIIDPLPESNPGSSELKSWSPNHWPPENSPQTHKSEIYEMASTEQSVSPGRQTLCMGQQISLLVIPWCHSIKPLIHFLISKGGSYRSSLHMICTLLIFPLHFALKILVIMEGPFPRPSHI